MEGNPCGSLEYQAQLHYPEPRCGGRNFRYAQAMLDNVGGSNSEMTAVAGYLYDALVMEEEPEVAEAFRRIRAVETVHLELFGALARQLGEDPRLWTVQQGRRQWWTPGAVGYDRRLGPLIRNAVRGEKAAIRKYRAQLRWVDDAGVQDVLRCVLADEEKHLIILNCLYDNYVGRIE